LDVVEPPPLRGLDGDDLVVPDIVIEDTTKEFAVEGFSQPLDAITTKATVTQHLLQATLRVAGTVADQRSREDRGHATTSEVRNDRLGLVRREIATTRATMTSQCRVRQCSGQRPAARSPHRHRVGEPLHVVDAGDANLPAGKLALDDPALDDA